MPNNHEVYEHQRIEGDNDAKQPLGTSTPTDSGEK